MSNNSIAPELAEIALSRAEGTRFERFFQDFFSAIVGHEFVPLGGTKDGGADAFLDLSIYGAKKVGSFYQASVQEDHRSKVKQTVKRLREFGRQPQQVTYVTSQIIPHIDVEEEELSEELNVTIRIRDRKYIVSNSNANNQTIAAFKKHLFPVLSFLEQPGNVPLIPKSDHVVSPAVYVFLRQEVDRRSGNRSLVDALTDSLILWALEGTDPDKGILMSKSEIRDLIVATVPPAKQIIDDRLTERLRQLAKKNNSTGREIRYYKKDEKYCLPFETRSLVQAENIQDEALRLKVISRFEERIASMKGGGLSPDLYPKAAELALKTIQMTFEKEGLEFAAFLSEGESKDSYESISDVVDLVLEGFEKRPNERIFYKLAICACLREAFYSSSDEERLYFAKLSRTYSLMFTLKAEPRLVEYFQNMASNFYLYIGTDILIKALSERYLKREDQMIRNLLSMMVESGAQLILAEPVLDEICSHLRISDWEFINHFSQQERYVDESIANQSRKILVRAYFHAKLDPKLESEHPKSWQQFVSQFCDYSSLHKPSTKEELRNYFVAQFRMCYESTEDISKIVDQATVQLLATKLENIKSDPKLALNDATLVFAVYGRRKQLSETAAVTQFGYRTWWVTGETRVIGYTKDIVKQNLGSWYMMRPEFILNFIALSPTTAEVRESYKNIFPSILGIRLSGRMREDIFHDLMSKMKEAQSLEEGRRQAFAAKLSDRLKGDFYKEYEKEFLMGDRSS